MMIKMSSVVARPIGRSNLFHDCFACARNDTIRAIAKVSKIFKWMFLTGIGIACVTINVSAQPVENDGPVKPVAGNVYVIEK